MIAAFQRLLDRLFWSRRDRLGFAMAYEACATMARLRAAHAKDATELEYYELEAHEHDREVARWRASL